MDVTVVPYSVLGTQLTNKYGVKNRSDTPDINTAFVDPAGLPFISKNGPRRAGGCSGAIYKFLGIQAKAKFEPDVVSAITAPTHAKYKVYGGGTKHAIHAVGPDFNEEECTPEQAIERLATTYANVLKQFAETQEHVVNLRLLPISGGIFAGKFKPELAELTFNALTMAFKKISNNHKKSDVVTKIKTSKLYMCIFEEKELEDFNKAFGQT